MWLDAGRLTEERMTQFHRQLHRFRPRIIQAYARAVVLFARYLQATGLKAYRPHSIVTSAEILEAEDRDLLEEVFGCPVFNRYGCREVSVVASECSAHSGLHVMAEGLYLEIETPNGPAAPGEMGAVLVTDLLNGGHAADPLPHRRHGRVGRRTLPVRPRIAAIWSAWRGASPTSSSAPTAGWCPAFFWPPTSSPSVQASARCRSASTGPGPSPTASAPAGVLTRKWTANIFERPRGGILAEGPV